MKYSPLLLLLTFCHTVLADEAALTQCRKIESIEDRVACYDDFVDSRYVAQNEQKPDAQSLFGTTDAEAKRIVETTLDIEQIDHIATTVVAVKSSASRKMTIALDNGQTWRQLDNERLRLKDGEAVIIRKASLGSYLLEKQSGSRSIRVKRVN